MLTCVEIVLPVKRCTTALATVFTALATLSTISTALVTLFSILLFSPSGTTDDLSLVLLTVDIENVFSLHGLGGMFSSSDSVRSIMLSDSDKSFTSSSERKRKV